MRAGHESKNYAPAGNGDIQAPATRYHARQRYWVRCLSGIHLKTTKASHFAWFARSGLPNARFVRIAFEFSLDVLLEMHEISALNCAIRDDYSALQNLVVLGQNRRLW